MNILTVQTDILLFLFLLTNVLIEVALDKNECPEFKCKNFGVCSLMPRPTCGPPAESCSDDLLLNEMKLKNISLLILDKHSCEAVNSRTITIMKGQRRT